MSLIHINIDDLLNQRTIEGIRIEYKAGWDKEIEQKTLRTICAFANDLYNINGGYIVLGVETNGPTPILPPIGLLEARLERILTEIRVLGTSRIEPTYNPIAEPRLVDGRWIIIIWVPGGITAPIRPRIPTKTIIILCGGGLRPSKPRGMTCNS